MPAAHDVMCFDVASRAALPAGFPLLQKKCPLGGGISAVGKVSSQPGRKHL